MASRYQPTSAIYEANTVRQRGATPLVHQQNRPNIGDARNSFHYASNESVPRYRRDSDQRYHIGASFNQIARVDPYSRERPPAPAPPSVKPGGRRESVVRFDDSARHPRHVDPQAVFEDDESDDNTGSELGGIFGARHDDHSHKRAAHNVRGRTSPDAIANKSKTVGRLPPSKQQSRQSQDHDDVSVSDDQNYALRSRQRQAYADPPSRHGQGPDAGTLPHPVGNDRTERGFSMLDQRMPSDAQRTEDRRHETAIRSDDRGNNRSRHGHSDARALDGEISPEARVETFAGKEGRDRSPPIDVRHGRKALDNEGGAARSKYQQAVTAAHKAYTSTKAQQRHGDNITENYTQRKPEPVSRPSIRSQRYDDDSDGDAARHPQGRGFEHDDRHGQNAYRTSERREQRHSKLEDANVDRLRRDMATTRLDDPRKNMTRREAVESESRDLQRDKRHVNQPSSRNDMPLGKSDGMSRNRDKDNAGVSGGKHSGGKDQRHGPVRAAPSLRKADDIDGVFGANASGARGERYDVPRNRSEGHGPVRAAPSLRKAGDLDGVFGAKGPPRPKDDRHGTARRERPRHRSRDRNDDLVDEASYRGAHRK
ncbi:uncharacterized protein HMPREF1541_01755 [Cyphellophora europaea CBS 101466]|uniref:Uncharacterized protein n=1 Tax=Cyphellophora europaea (strain CBS 101466) TaxID=1220924 RepID=W2S3I4_CYPE1|nr:uncharacterized protein HMPREF1541_01755 [Cyphellophora europaea CBS 101466]ETN42598.1 hypothetical protein HMPREF1541_01755 [Cyphellophora europaea CBS 101466]